MDTLMADAVAREYWRVNSWKKILSAHKLVEDINEWMASKGLAKSAISRYDVAQYVVDLQRQSVATPEQAAWEQNVSSGTTADDAALQRADELMLAGQVQAMSQAEYAANRERLRVTQSLGSFLGGRE